MSEHLEPAPEGGESACYAHLICPECTTLLDGGDHAPSCHWAPPDPLTSFDD